jgi:hypothetical protein
MGQYYKFVNLTLEQESDIPLPFNFNLSWAKDLENYSPEELQEKFAYVIEKNHWNEQDEIVAIGDYGNQIYRPNSLS